MHDRVTMVSRGWLCSRQRAESRLRRQPSARFCTKRARSHRPFSLLFHFFFLVHPFASSPVPDVPDEAGGGRGGVQVRSGVRIKRLRATMMIISM